MAGYRPLGAALAVIAFGLGCVAPGPQQRETVAPQQPAVAGGEPAAGGAPADAEPSPPAAQVAAPVPSGALADEQAAYDYLVRELHVGFYRPRHKDNKQYMPADGYLAPVARTSDGGFVFGGQAEVDGASKPVLGKIDGDGNVQWLVALDRSIYRAYEGGLINETPDGHYVGFVMSYVDPSGFPVHSFAKITPAGETVWKLELPRDQYGNTPQVHLAKVAADSSVVVQGHLYRGKRGKGDRPAYRWTARITPDGKLTDERTGTPLDWAKDEW